MKLLRYGPLGKEKPAVIDHSGNIRDLSAHISDICGDNLTAEKIATLQKIDLNTLPLVENTVRLGSCLNVSGKFICIGLNYKDHALETGAKAPAEPVVFSKFNSAVCGPYDDIHIPKNSTHTDWEVELAVVIGKMGLNISEASAMEHVAGYCVANDVSERFFQKHMSGQWIKGKSYETFAPLGPWLVTKDEVPDPGQLSIWLKLDGKMMQNGHTSDMLFKVPFLVSYLSQFFTLQPGDIISTGTPAGVGAGIKPQPVFLKAGSSLEFGIDRLGVQQHIVVAD